MMTWVISHSWTREIVFTVLILSLSLWMVQLRECTSSPLRGFQWALQSAEDCALVLTFTSVPRGEMRAGAGQSTDRGARWENGKISEKAHNYIKEAREEHVVAIETEQRLNKSSIGKTEAADVECVEIVCCLSFVSVRTVKCSMCQERRGFSLCYFNEYSESGFSKDWYLCPLLQNQSLLQHLNQKNLLWNQSEAYLCEQELWILGCQSSVILTDVFIWTHDTFHTCPRNLVDPPLSTASGHNTRCDSNQAFECLYAWTNFFFSFIEGCNLPQAC